MRWRNCGNLISQRLQFVVSINAGTSPLIPAFLPLPIGKNSFPNTEQMFFTANE